MTCDLGTCKDRTCVGKPWGRTTPAIGQTGSQSACGCNRAWQRFFLAHFSNSSVDKGTYFSVSHLRPEMKKALFKFCERILGDVLLM